MTDDEHDLIARLIVSFGPGCHLDDQHLDARQALTAAAADPDDLWAWWDHGATVVIPTNTDTRSDGTAVMGAGIAAAAATRIPELAARYGQALTAGRAFCAYPAWRVLCAPTKHHWRNPATLDTVTEAVERIAGWARRTSDVGHIAVPALGCGHGQLAWDQIAPILQHHLRDPRFVILPPP